MTVHASYGANTLSLLVGYRMPPSVSQHADLRGRCLSCGNMLKLTVSRGCCNKLISVTCDAVVGVPPARGGSGRREGRGWRRLAAGLIPAPIPSVELAVMVQANLATPLAPRDPAPAASAPYISQLSAAMIAAAIAAGLMAGVCTPPAQEPAQPVGRQRAQRCRGLVQAEGGWFKPQGRCTQIRCARSGDYQGCRVRGEGPVAVGPAHLPARAGRHRDGPGPLRGEGPARAGRSQEAPARLVRDILSGRIDRTLRAMGGPAPDVAQHDAKGWTWQNAGRVLQHRTRALGLDAVSGHSR